MSRLPKRHRTSPVGALIFPASFFPRTRHLSIDVERRSTRHDLSKKMSARAFGAAVRGHWAIANRLHWHLDVTFGEDHCRTRKGRADANFSILRRTALSLLRNEKTAKDGMKNQRLTAGWNDHYLEKVLFGT